MKRLLGVLLLVAAFTVMMVHGASAAKMVYENRISGYWSGQGGEFTLVPSNDWVSILSTYNSLATYTYTNPVSNDFGAIGFESFCMEMNEHVSVPGTYYVEISGAAIKGGLSGGNPDPISVGTAWLYHEFQNGTLKGYDYYNTAGGTSSGRALSAAALQDTIWWLEGEVGDPGAGNVFRNAVIAQYNSPALAMADNNGAIRVGVLNMWTDVRHTVFNQDMLVCLPVPEPTTLLLLGAGLIGFAALRRRFPK